VRFVVFFLVTFGIAMAGFAVARALGLTDLSWHDAYLGAAAIASALAVLNLWANKGTRRLPTSR
jgi:hypothetical protein